MATTAEQIDVVLGDKVTAPAGSAAAAAEKLASALEKPARGAAAAAAKYAAQAAAQDRAAAAASALAAQQAAAAASAQQLAAANQLVIALAQRDASIAIIEAKAKTVAAAASDKLAAAQTAAGEAAAKEAKELADLRASTAAASASARENASASRMAEAASKLLGSTMQRTGSAIKTQAAAANAAREAADKLAAAQASGSQKAIISAQAAVADAAADLGEASAATLAAAATDLLSIALGAVAAAAAAVLVVVTAAAAAFIVFAAAVWSASESLTEYALRNADAQRTTNLTMTAILKSSSAARELEGSIDKLATKVPVARDRLEAMAKSLALAGLRGESLQRTLRGLATEEAVVGADAASKLEALINRSAAAGKFEVKAKQLAGTGIAIQELYAQIAADTGQSIDKIAGLMKAGKISVEQGTKALDEVIARKFGGAAAALSLGFENQLLKVKESVAGLFKDIDVGPFLKALHSVFSMLDAGTPAAKMLQGSISKAFGAVFDALAKLAPYAHAFFEGAIAGAKGLFDELGKLAGAASNAMGTPNPATLEMLRHAVPDAIAYLKGMFGDLKADAMAFWAGLKSGAAGLQAAIKSAFPSNAGEGTAGTFRSIGETVGKATVALVKIAGALATVVGWLGQAGDSTSSAGIAFTALGVVFKGVLGPLYQFYDLYSKVREILGGDKASSDAGKAWDSVKTDDSASKAADTAEKSSKSAGESGSEEATKGGEQSGKNFSAGFASGIGSNQAAVDAAAANMATGAAASSNRAIGARSPAQLIADTTGKWFALGMAKGMNDNAHVPAAAAANMAQRAAAASASSSGASAGPSPVGAAATSSSVTNLYLTHAPVTHVTGGKDADADHAAAGRANEESLVRSLKITLGALGRAA